MKLLGYLFLLAAAGCVFARDAQSAPAGATGPVSRHGRPRVVGTKIVDEASTREWIAFVREHQLCLCNWAVSDKPETASIIKPGASPTGHWTDKDLSPAGVRVRERLRGWAETAKTPCP